MGAEGLDVRRASVEDEQTIIDVLADAFSRDPVTRWAIYSPPRSTAKLRHLFKGAVGQVLRRSDQEIYLTGDGRGVAVWFPPKRHKQTTGEQLRSAPELLRGVGVGGLFRGARLQRPIDAAHPEDEHYYLAFLGTRQTAQGKGVGSGLLRSMLERCDAEGMPAYLENSNPRNTALYARHGFEERGLIDVPQGCPPLLGMWRVPR